MTQEKQTQVSLFSTMKSVLSAALGVQSSKNLERDFTKGSFKSFVIIGIVSGLIFILGVYAVVSWVLSEAGL